MGTSSCEKSGRSKKEFIRSKSILKTALFSSMEWWKGFGSLMCPYMVRSILSIRSSIGHDQPSIDTGTDLDNWSRIEIWDGYQVLASRLGR